jgi:hypothetical protein
MDKRKIHIDDLVRSRLSGAEEREPAGAWASMRALLDKEMPVETAAFNWKRMLSYATALLLATSVSVGGYNYYRHTAPLKEDAGMVGFNTSADNKTPIAINDAANHLAVKAAHSNIQTYPTATNHNKPKTTPARYSNKPTGSSTITAADTTAPALGNSIATINGTAQPSGLLASATSGGRFAERNQRQNASLKLASGNIGPLFASGATTSNALPYSQSLTPASGNQPSSAPANGASATAANLPARPRAQASVLLATTPVESLQATPTYAASLVDDHRVAPIVTPGQPLSTLRKDTIRQIEIVYHRVINPGTNTMQYRKDTIAITKFLVEKKEPVVPSARQQPAIAQQQIKLKSAPALVNPSPSPRGNTFAQAASSDPVPQAAMPLAEVAASENIKLVSLSQFRVASRFSNFWNSEHFNRMVQQVKMNLSRAQFYAGITGGLNASLFSGTSLIGLQAGLTGLLAFNDQWSVAGELKFYQRFNTGNSIKDNYIKKTEWMPGSYSTINGVSYREWSWKEDSVAHSYNLTTVQTLELPLLLRYNFGRFFTEAGINMMYAFAVNVEELDKPNGNVANVSRTMPASFTPESISGAKPTISVGDFSSRFGLGYALGMGYQLTPALQANCRLVHSVWDNAGSVGGQKVSRSLYQTPSIQVSIGYRFKQGKGR